MDDDQQQQQQQIDPRKDILGHCIKVLFLFIISVAYLFGGAALFQYFEREMKLRDLYSANVQLEQFRADLLKTLWAHALVCTENDWNQLANERVDFYERQLNELADNLGNRNLDWSEYPWSITDSLFYAFSVITTIVFMKNMGGFGDVSPRTREGKIATVIYGLFGIPLMIALLLQISRLLVALANRCRLSEERFVAMLFVACLVTGTMLFGCLEQLDWVDACYFSFITFTSIGFGDIVPSHDGYFLICILYIIGCLALVSLCFDLLGRRIDACLDRLMLTRFGDNGKAVEKNSTDIITLDGQVTNAVELNCNNESPLAEVKTSTGIVKQRRRWQSSHSTSKEEAN
ncbi:TWiK family of potassium channels protein 7 [Trichinella pseudospiralis]|uniref:TWiK family of potassium channels protein 7 n=1 Tax=Trichinella pseudospiralis TaxID=6337 RepID=A0A0V1G391_TRIPS|nr:TWiK family of potassium channels protein 7 [Trichinella pseudospiralis]